MNTFSSKNINCVDSLTKVFTQEYIKDYVNYLFSKNIPFSYLFIDIDNFKIVNDSYGRSAGDEILKILAEKIQSISESWGTLGRYEGNKYVMVISNCVDYDTLWNYSRTIIKEISELEFKNYNGLYLTATIGLVRVPQDACTYDEIVQKAEKALYRGKTKGRNCFIIYIEEKHAGIVVGSKKNETLSSTYLHTMIFRHLAESKNIKLGINNLFNFLGSFFGFEHICIQTEDKLYFETFLGLNKELKFEPLDLSKIRNLMDNSTETFSFNDRLQLQDPTVSELRENFEAQNVQAGFFCNISSHNINYGVIRIDLVNKKRVWQSLEKDIFVIAGKFIGYYLYEHKNVIEDLLKKD